MPRYPHLKLFKCFHHIVILSGPHFQVLNAQNGQVIFSTANITWEDEEGVGVSNSGPIRCSGMTEDGRYLATTGDDKRLKVWDLESFTFLGSRELPKKPMAIEFTRNKDILVSDKFGDVFRYQLHPQTELPKEKRDKFASHENPSGGELILGHASVLTSCLLTPDERHIITADRDEHIRISWYPEGYVIEGFCLGHKRYVSALHILMASPTGLISGGGDHELKVWNWMTGRLQRDIAVYATVEPFIVVTAQSRLERDRDYEVAASPSRAEEPAVGEDQLDADFVVEYSSVHRSLGSSNELANATTTIFVVRRISSFILGSETHVVFSAVGATALFEFILAEHNDHPDVRHHDFGKPVIDFTLGEEGLIWVLLDADFREETEVSEVRPRKLVEAVQWTKQGFVYVHNSPLLDSLNTICSLPATADDLKALDLYSDLSSLPKRIGGKEERQPPEQMELIHEHIVNEQSEEAASSTSLTRRALGRMKHKRALNQLRHEKNGDNGRRDAKKMKADVDSVNEG